MTGISLTDRIALRSKRWIKGEQGRRLLFCMLCTFLWGLAAHAYAYMNSSFSHDSLTIFADAHEELWKLELGRVFVPVYRALLRGSLAAPWLMGMVSLLWLSFAAYLVVDMLEQRSKALIVLTTGIMCTNLTVAALNATYIYEVDVDMFALLVSVAAVWFWQKWTGTPTGKARQKYAIASALCMWLSLGLYQSYISVTLVLVILLSMRKIFEGGVQAASS